MLSVIVPAYNEESVLSKTAETLTGILKNADISHEIIFIDDGSSDKTWEIIEGLASETIKGLRFSRNFGKEGAIFAGLNAAKGNCVVVIDCDLQHPPEIIPKMYKLWQEGYEIIDAKKASRGKESLLYKTAAKTFYKIMCNSSELDIEKASDYKLIDRKAVDALLALPERLTFFRALSSWVGFKRTVVEFEVQPRFAGTTKWNYKKLISFALSNLTSFSNLPMQFITFAGVIFFLFALILGGYTIADVITGKAIKGYPTTILLILIVGSFLMMGLGIIGYYISKIYEEIKFRPRYIVKEETGGKKDED